MRWLPLIGWIVVSPVVAAQETQPLSVSALNEAFGIPIWADENLWDDTDADVAARLKWPLESRTSNDASYRIYTGPGAVVLGTRPFSMALYGESGKASQLSMVFANKGDILELAQIDPGQDPLKVRQEMMRAARDYKRFIQRDASEIEARLTKALGPPAVVRFGETSETAERAKRWDWKGHAILLAAPREEYAAVRVMPAAVADGEGRERVPDADMRARLAGRVERRANGDVILKDIPMVDQGPRGYCVPATWERALRYMGIPADMYVLAMAGATEAGGGTVMRDMSRGAGELVRRRGRRMVSESGPISLRNIAKRIDEGLPILWGMFSIEEIERITLLRTLLRKGIASSSEWKSLVDPWRKRAKKVVANPDSAHVCMIIGYNEKTGEIAVTDSWGPEFAERWITVEEAEAISGGEFYVIHW